MEGIFSALGTLLAVGAILYLTYIASKYIGKGSMALTQSKYLKTLDRASLSQDKSLAIVQAGEKYYLIGITQNSISRIAELNSEDLIELQENGTNLAQPNFKEALLKFGSKEKK